MELTELYDQISNPLDDPSIIEKLIMAYANKSQGSGGYYGHLIRIIKMKQHGICYQEDADKFHAMLFNKWKNNILALTEDEVTKLLEAGEYGADFVKMRNYLSKIHDVSTQKEASEIFYGRKGDAKLENALEKYSWRSFGKSTGWFHVCSKYLTAKKDSYPNIEHRLYLNTESVDTYKILIYLVEKCDEHHLPYYFKFDPKANRDDNIVLYSSNENITKYVEILQEIKREHPGLISRIKEPPVLTGKIDGWIGYGAQPEKIPGRKKHSFNATRAELLDKSIDKVTKQWVMKHRNQQIIYQGQKISLQDYIAVKATEKLIVDLTSDYLRYEDEAKKRAQAKGITYYPTMVSDRLGYALLDIKSPEVKQNIYEFLRDRIIISLPQICNGSYEDVETIKMEVRNGKHVSFNGYMLDTVIQKLSLNILKKDPNFIKDVQTEIKSNAKQYGIDSEKFCFNVHTSEKIKDIIMQQKKQKHQQVQQQKLQRIQQQAYDSVPTKKVETLLESSDDKTQQENITKEVKLYVGYYGLSFAVYVNSIRNKKDIEYNRFRFYKYQVDRRLSCNIAKALMSKDSKEILIDYGSYSNSQNGEVRNEIYKYSLIMKPFTNAEDFSKFLAADLVECTANEEAYTSFLSETHTTIFSDLANSSVSAAFLNPDGEITFNSILEGLNEGVHRGK